LLRSPGEPIAGTPGPYLKAWELRSDTPLAPAHFRVAVERHRSPLEPDALVLAHGGQAAAEVEPFRAGLRGEQLVERRRLALGQTQQVPIGCRMELAQP